MRPVFRGLASRCSPPLRQPAATPPTRLGDSRRVELADGDVVEEGQGLCAGAHDVVGGLN